MNAKKTPRETLSRLQAMLGEVESRQKLLAGERATLAYDALCDDAKAAKRLGQINADLSIIDQEIASVQAAIAEAARRVGEADTQARAEAEAAKKRRALIKSADLVDMAAELDEHLAAFFRMYNGFRVTMIDLHRDGAAPQINIVDSVCRRALESASMGTRLQLMHLAPGDRITFESLATSWKQNIEAQNNETPHAGAKKEAA
jgi:hypothetical protein